MIVGPGGSSLDTSDAAEWLLRARSGDFERAWQASDRIRRRLRRDQYQTGPRHTQHVWDGTPIDGRRVLIRCYHGLGDTIQFIRYVPMVRASAASVLVWAQPPLLPLLAGVPGIDRLLPLHDGSPDAEYDVDVEVMELPYLFRTTLSTIPASTPYLSATPHLSGTPAAFCGNPPRIGIAWRAGTWEQNRSMPFERVAELLDAASEPWCSLQLDQGMRERHPRLATIDVSSVVRTAAVISRLDLVITIDSMAAHLSGALGVPTWTLLPHDADWRWMAGRGDSPWYPAMRLFRQRAHGDWRSVIDQVRAALEAT